MARKHVKSLLSAYIQDELDGPRSEHVQQHLLACKKCQAEHDRIKLGSKLAAQYPRIHPTDDVWQGVRSQLDQGNTLSKLAAMPTRQLRALPRLGYTLAGMTAMALIWWTVFDRATPPLQVELGDYLRRIEASSNVGVIGFASLAPSNFGPADRFRAGKAAGVDHVLAREPLPDFQLVAQRVRMMQAEEAVQLVYSSKKEMFVVFVSPESIDFSFEGRDMKPTELEEISCRRVASSAVGVFWFGAGGFHCVLVSPFEDTAKNATIIRYFVEAHNILKKNI